MQRQSIGGNQQSTALEEKNQIVEMEKGRQHRSRFFRNPPRDSPFPCIPPQEEHPKTASQTPGQVFQLFLLKYLTGPAATDIDHHPLSVRQLRRLEKILQQNRRRRFSKRAPMCGDRSMHGPRRILLRQISTYSRVESSPSQRRHRVPRQVNLTSMSAIRPSRCRIQGKSGTGTTRHSRWKISGSPGRDPM